MQFTFSPVRRPDRHPAKSILLLGPALVGLVALAGCTKDGLRVGADVDVALDQPSGEPIGLNVSGEVPVNVSLAGLGDQPLTLALSGEVPVNVTLQMPDGGGSTGTYVSAETINTFKVNETKAEVVDAVIGHPDRVTTLSDGSEIWVWEFGPATPLVQVNVITGKDSDEAASTHVRCFVQVRDGVVVAVGRG